MPKKKVKKTKKNVPRGTKNKSNRVYPSKTDHASCKFNKTAQTVMLNLYKEGKTDVQVAKILGVTEKTINNWKHDYPDLFQSIKVAKKNADEEVVQALRQRALGYKHDSVEIKVVSDGQGEGSHIEEVPVVKQYPPDTKACEFWLKNRQPEEWRDKQEIEHSAKPKTIEEFLKEKQEELK